MSILVVTTLVDSNGVKDPHLQSSDTHCGKVLGVFIESKNHLARGCNVN